MMNDANNTGPPPLVLFGALEFGAAKAETRGVMKNRVNRRSSPYFATF